MVIKDLEKLADDIYIYISQHAIYINNLIKATEGKIEFNPTDCHSCAFGKNFDEIIRKHIQDYPEDIKSILEDIYRLHCQFHNLSFDILKDKEEEKLNEIKDISTHLFQDLLKLKTKLGILELNT